MDFKTSGQLAEVSKLFPSDNVYFPVGGGKTVGFRTRINYMGGLNNHPVSCDLVSRALHKARGEDLVTFIRNRYKVTTGTWPEIIRANPESRSINDYYATVLRNICYDIMHTLELYQHRLSPDAVTNPSLKTELTEMERAEALYAKVSGRPMAEDPYDTLPEIKSPSNTNPDTEWGASNIISYLKSKKDGRSKSKSVIKVRRSDCKIQGSKGIRRTAIRR